MACCAPPLSLDKQSLTCGGETGQVCQISAKGEISELANIGNKWIDCVATGPNSSVAFSSGKTAHVVSDGEVIREITCDRTIEALAFAPKGMRLALARYDGVELHWVNSNSPSQFLEWKGAHIGVSFSPDGKSVVSSMQENALHGWRLSDQRHMQMTGYPAKVKSASWSNRGRWLATSGAPAAIVWPFSGKDGPMGKAPKELGSMGQILVTCVSCHPTEDVIALGYENGMIMAVKIEDGQVVSIRSEGEGEISSLNWDDTGTRLAFGSIEGEAGIIDVSSR